MANILSREILKQRNQRLVFGFFFGTLWEKVISLIRVRPNSTPVQILALWFYKSKVSFLAAQGSFFLGAMQIRLGFFEAGLAHFSRSSDHLIFRHASDLLFKARFSKDRVLFEDEELVRAADFGSVQSIANLIDFLEGSGTVGARQSELILQRLGFVKRFLVLRLSEVLISHQSHKALAVVGAHEVGSRDGDLKRRIYAGILQYRSPDEARSSTNIGDFVQSLAVAQHWIGHRRVEVDASPYLNRLASPSSARNLTAGSVIPVDFVPINRDTYNPPDTVPERTWVFASGWFSHAVFGLRPEILEDENIVPIFLSFHISSTGVVTNGLVKKLKAAQPIGCRDMWTRDLLRTLGVEAFFSGCLTTTFGRVAGQSPLPLFPATTDGSLGVDIGGFDEESTAVVRDLHRLSVIEGMERALETLEEWLAWSSVSTSRLHCFLPLESLGHENLQFLPRETGDVRFTGLIDIGRKGRERMAIELSSLMSDSIDIIVDGAGVGEFRAFWRDRVNGFEERIGARELDA